METSQLLAVAGATFLLGVIRVSYGYYKEWKASRLLLPAPVRNAGFWTDRKLLILERTVVTVFALYVGSLLAMLIWLVGGAQGLWCWPYCAP